MENVSFWDAFRKSLGELPTKEIFPFPAVPPHPMIGNGGGDVYLRILMFNSYFEGKGEKDDEELTDYIDSIVWKVHNLVIKLVCTVCNVSEQDAFRIVLDVLQKKDDEQLPEISIVNSIDGKVDQVSFRQHIMIGLKCICIDPITERHEANAITLLQHLFDEDWYSTTATIVPRLFMQGNLPIINMVRNRITNGNLSDRLMQVIDEDLRLKRKKEQEDKIAAFLQIAINRKDPATP